ncbi:MAG: anthranilate phosphoribosyltransferase [Oscillospiraceae bacterium]|nr:anthranilate phosphoribosyltransferase [Oscillospiraceae bacterium]
MIAEAIKKLRTGADLSYAEAYACMDEIMSGQTSQVQTTAFLCLLAMKGETRAEISACAAGMRDKAIPVNANCDTLEIVGTGGDGAGSFNISSTAAFVIAAGGQPVAKHGNRAASSKSGAADCLEALGVNIQQEPETCVKELDEVGICFLFAQKYHTAMRYVGGIRKELGIRTVFNVLGPLTNPARPKYQVLGVFAEDALENLAGVLPELGVERGIAVFARDGMDELSSSCENVICEVVNGEKHTSVITPEELGLTRCKKSDLVGGTPQENAQITLDVLSGKPGPCRDTVLMNAAAGLYISGKADTLAQGVKLAAEVIDSGKALATLNAFIKLSNS